MTTDDDRVNIEQSASGRLEGRVLQFHKLLLKRERSMLGVEGDATLLLFTCVVCYTVYLQICM